MRLTTKIVLGIISSLFLISVLFIIGFSFTDKTKWKRPLPELYSEYISQENIVEIPITEYKTIYLDYKPEETDYNILPRGIVFVNPASGENEKQKFSLPEEMKEYLIISQVNDTLRVLFDKEKMAEAFETPDDQQISLAVRGMNLYLNSNKVDVINNLGSTIGLEIKDIQTDHIKLKSQGSMFIDACEAISVSPLGKGEFKMLNSTLQNLNLDLDNTSIYTVDDCNIDVQNLTGSKDYKHAIIKVKNNTKELNWYPKSKIAQLELTIFTDTAKVIFR